MEEGKLSTIKSKTNIRDQMHRLHLTKNAPEVLILETYTSYLPL